jgi:hypothetical protein
MTKKIPIPALLLASLVQAFAPGHSAFAEESYESVKSEVDRLALDYRNHCTSETIAKFGHELQSKNGITGGASAAFHRAGVRINCGNPFLSGEELFLCEARTLCHDKWSTLVQRQSALGRMTPPPAPAATKERDVPPPPPPAANPSTTEETANNVVVPPPAKTGQSPVYTSANNYCGIPDTVQVPGSQSDAVLVYRRTRTFNQIRYELCKETEAGDEASCSKLFSKAAMIDIRASSRYYADAARAKQKEYYDCLKDKYKEGAESEIKAIQKPDFLRAVEDSCLEESDDSLSSRQAAMYVADLPTCRSQAAVSTARATSKGEDDSSSASGGGKGAGEAN